MAICRTQAIFWISTIAICVAGCHSENPERDKIWASDPTPYVPRENSQNAFDTYALAALDAEKLTQAFAGRVSFYPDQKSKISKEIAASTKAVVRATGLPCEFKFVPHRPFLVSQYQTGWRMIGRVFQWNAEDACLKGDFDTAITNVVSGTKFGFDLTGGGATDTSLGLSIANNVRRVIASYIGKFSPTQLDRLAKGIKEGIQRRPAISNSISNERLNILLSIQYLQEVLKSGETKTLVKNMGPDVNEALRYLDQIHSNKKKQDAFFSGLDKAAEDELMLIQHDAAIPVSQRLKTKSELVGPWKKLPKHLLGSLRPMLEMNDATVARTRLLILYAEILKFGKEKKPYPEDLTAFTKDLTVDPYSGGSFLYHADQAEFSIYSVGVNGRDDGGDTDETFTFPDLRLEVSPQ